MSGSHEILKRMADSYRRMRNTARFLLGNLHGFDPARGPGCPADHGGSRPLGARPDAAACRAEIVAAYDAYEFHRVYQLLHNFCVVDLGGFYLDVIKDRLYTTPRDRPSAPLRADRDVPRRRGDGALARAGAELHGRGNLAVAAGARVTSSVFTSTWHELPARRDGPRLDWDLLLRVRDIACARARSRCGRRDRIGSGLDAARADLRGRRGWPRAGPCPATNCASCSSPRRQRASRRGAPGRCAGRRGVLGQRRAESTTASASAAGIVGRTSARSPAHPAICGRCAINVEGAGREPGIRLTTERNTCPGDGSPMPGGASPGAAG